MTSHHITSHHTHKPLVITIIMIVINICRHKTILLMSYHTRRRIISNPPIRQPLHTTILNVPPPRLVVIHRTELTHRRRLHTINIPPTSNTVTITITTMQHKIA